MLVDTIPSSKVPPVQQSEVSKTNQKTLVSNVLIMTKLEDVKFYKDDITSLIDDVDDDTGVYQDVVYILANVSYSSISFMQSTCPAISSWLF